MNDEFYMKRAIELAQKGCGRTSPNPMVGAVIVKDGRMIGEGWHHKYGDLHAERDALKNCTEDPKGASVYVTLEPCCHHGKQPPCTDALIAAGISRVIVGSGDPNPLVAGKGIRILREHGIEVTEHVCEEECRDFNDVFFHYITTGLPFTAMKYAMTLDGKIACYTGKSRWVTGQCAREHVHTLRNRYRGIMAGINTVLADDPLLTCRLPGGRSPVRIIPDSQLRIPLSSQIVKTAREYETVVACCTQDPALVKPLEDAGITVLFCPDELSGKVSIPALMKLLGERGIDSILLEGGAQLNWSVLQAGYVQKVYAYVAPKLFGGEGAKSPVGGQGFPSPDMAVRLEHLKTSRLGEDFLIEGRVVY